MYILVWISIIMGVYVYTFKSDFKDEDIQKVAPVMVILLLLSVLMAAKG